METVLTFFDKGKVILATILYSVASFFFYLLKKRGAVPRTTAAPVPTTLTAVSCLFLCYHPSQYEYEKPDKTENATDDYKCDETCTFCVASLCLFEDTLHSPN